MNTWQKNKLGNICEVFNGKTPSRTEQRKKGYPLLKIKNIGLDGELIRFEAFVDENFLNKFKNKTLQKGDVLVLNAAHTSSYVGSKKYYWNKNLTNILPTGEWTVIRAKDQITSYFIYLWLLSSEGKATIKSIVRGIHLYPKDIANLSVNMPDEIIKRQIVEKLDAIRKLQELNNKEIEKAEELFNSLLTNLLKPKQDWQTKKLGEIADILMGQSPPSNTYNITGEGLPFFQGKADFNDVYPSVSKYCSKPVRVAQKDDVLLSIRAPVGPVNLAPSQVCIGRGLSAIRGKWKVLNQMYLFYYMELNELALGKKGTGSTFSSINRRDIEKIDLPLPPLSIQQQIVKKLDAIRNYQVNLKKQKDKLSELFESTLNKAMRPN